MSAVNVMTYWIKSLEFYQQWKFIEKIYQTEQKQNEKNDKNKSCQYKIFKEKKN